MTKVVIVYRQVRPVVHLWDGDNWPN